MAVIFAVTKLFDDVVSRFAADAAAQDPPATPVPNVFGWREPGKQRMTSHRVAWVPGDDDGGEMGAVGSAQQPGREPRPLATLDELVTVYIEAADTTSPENERAQYAAARELFDAWYRAIYLAARATFEVRSARWVTSAKERRHGATIRVLLAVQAMVPDAPLEAAPVDVSAAVTTHLEPNDTEGETDAVSPD